MMKVGERDMNAVKSLATRKKEYQEKRETKRQKRIKPIGRMLGLIVLLVGLFTFSISSFAAGDDSYTVKKGDTLSALALKYHVSVSQLESANMLKSDRIYVGQVLTVPMIDKKTGKFVQDGPGLEKGEVMYTIQKGDTIASIAKKFGVTQQSIIQTNHLEVLNYKLYPGRWLTIETATKGVSSSKNVSEPSGANVNVPTVTYIVQKGDYITSLADRFGDTVSELKQVNNLKSDNLYAGESLKVPSSNLTWTKGTIDGAVDNTSVEVMSHYVPIVLQVSPGSATHYEGMVGHEGDLKIWYTKGSKNQRQALVSVEEVN